MSRRVIRILGLCAALSTLFWMATGMGWWLGCPADNPVCGRTFLIGWAHIAFMVAGIMIYL
jgi:hypothetical protein